MRSLSLSVDQFAADRRSAQDRLVERLTGVVGAFLSTGSYADLRAALATMWDEEFARETDAAPIARDRERFLDATERSLEKATADSSVQTTSLALANSVLNDAAHSAASTSDDIVMEWVAMRDDDVRPSHRRANGQQRPVGEMFSVGISEMPYPGWMGAPIEEWIGCRCALRPARPNEFAGRLEAMKSKIVTAEALTAAPGVTNNSLCVMALPAFDDAVHAVGPEEKHVTMLYFGDVTDQDDVDEVVAAVGGVAGADDVAPHTYDLKGVEQLGDEGAQVWMIDPGDGTGPISVSRKRLLEDNETIARLYAAVDQYPQYTPHVTIGYQGNEDEPELTDEALEDARSINQVTVDRLAVWHGDDRYEFPLGGSDMDADTTETEQVDIEDIELSEDEIAPERVPWYGVLAPEGVPSGDGRTFAEGSLRHRDLPLPLTWQEVSAEGHDQNVTVATIEWIERRGNLLYGGGNFLLTQDKADSVIGMISEFGRFGVSIDADDATFDLTEDGGTEFSDARVCSACIVSIPAFSEAFVTLGLDPDHDYGDEEDELNDAAEGGVDPVENLKEAAGETVEAKRGPGWVTHPKETRRLHRYWTQPGQPGFIKIGWGQNGSQGDFNRCRALVGEKIAANSPEDLRHLNAICAQWHHDALGIWPGQKLSAADSMKFKDQGPAITLVASGGWSAPSSFFAEPTDKECPPGEGIVFSEDGRRVFGYIAEWDVCHIGLGEACTTAPPSATDYAYFRTGTVTTEEGEDVKVGRLTYATGHANPRLAAQPAAAHYDDTGSAWAYVAAGENDRGIWFSGMVRPGLDEAALGEIKASSRISGDWRRLGDNLELVAALSVNTPGFPIQKPQVSLAAGAQISLVAAGVVDGERQEQGKEPPIDYSRLASSVADEIEGRQRRRERIASLKNELGG